MFVPVDCSQCRKPFQVPEPALGKPTPCPWCNTTVLALPLVTAPASISPGPDHTGSEPTSAPDEGVHLSQGAPPSPQVQLLSLDDDRPAGSPEPAQPARSKANPSPGRWAVLIAVALVLGAAATAATVLLLRYKQGYGASQEFQSVTPPDGSCVIDLLGTPVEEDAGPERWYVSRGWYSGTLAWVGWKALTAAQVQEAESEKGWVSFRRDVFDPERERLKSTFGGPVDRDATISQNPLTVEVRLDGPGGPMIERMIVRPGGPRPRVYFIGLAGKRLDPDGPVVRRLFDSFRVME